MHSKTSFKKYLFFSGIAGIIFSLMVILFVVSSYGLRKTAVNSSVESVQNIVSAQQVIPGIPVRLKIPTINVDAEIDPVGVTSKGEVGVPRGPTILHGLISTTPRRRR